MTFAFGSPPPDVRAAYDAHRHSAKMTSASVATFSVDETLAAYRELIAKLPEFRQLTLRIGIWLDGEELAPVSVDCWLPAVGQALAIKQTLISAAHRVEVSVFSHDADAAEAAFALGRKAS